jgi:hypothetical protein
MDQEKLVTSDNVGFDPSEVMPGLNQFIGFIQSPMVLIVAMLSIFSLVICFVVFSLVMFLVFALGVALQPRSYFLTTPSS